MRGSVFRCPCLHSCDTLRRLQSVTTFGIMMAFCKMCMEIPRGIFSAEDAEERGFSRMRLSSLVDSGRLERLARGVYAEPGVGNIPMVEAAVLAKRGTDFVLSLESALRFHDFTTATPHALWVSIRRGTRRPSVVFPIEVTAVDRETYLEGVEEHDVAGVVVRVYSAAKTVADLFKFRSRVGLELALGALKEGFRRNLFSVDELMRFARVDRVKNVMLPYVEGYFG